MRDMVLSLLAVVLCLAVCIVPVCASDDPVDEPVVEDVGELPADEDEPEEAAGEDIPADDSVDDDSEGDASDDDSEDDELDENDEQALLERQEFEDDRWEALLEAVAGLAESDSQIDGEEIPAIHELIPVSGGVQSRSIATQTTYPYTGGSFVAMTTNYGTGVMVLPEAVKTNALGFVKGTDRIVNLTASTISGYWVMGGVTYTLQIARFSEPQYQYTSGSTTTWRTLTISAMTDSNIQFLDETGERGIQRPYMTLTDKLLFVFIAVELLVHGLQLLRGRR